MKRLHIFLIAVIICITPSCKKFLAQYSQNKTFIQKATDLDELLIGGGYFQPDNTALSVPFYLDDDLEHLPPLNRPSTTEFLQFGIHFWQRRTDTQMDGSFLGFSSEGTTYDALYQYISTLNTILYNIPALREKNEPAPVLQRVAGEAHFLRAFYYFFLVNIFGKPYSAATAATDYGVPLKTDPDVQRGYMTRASVKQVYDQIVSDLLDAEKELAGFNEKIQLRANQSAAQALLSRVYLYREEYDNAVMYANKVMKKQYQLRDINTLPSTAFFVEKTSPEIIFTAITNSDFTKTKMNDPEFSSHMENFRVSEDLLSAYSNKDLRLQTFFRSTNRGDHLARKSGIINGLSDFSTVRLPEVFLNKAEALAILGRNEEAVATIQELRKNRFKREYLTDLNISGTELIQFVRDERRRELCFELHRWFDLRRYGVNSRFPFGKTIRHRYLSYNGSEQFMAGYYELKPYALEPAAYVQPIPQDEILFNKGSIKNEDRSERPLVQ